MAASPCGPFFEMSPGGNSMLAETPAPSRPLSVDEGVPAAKDLPHTATKSAPRRVLVVDDEALVRWAIGQTLDPHLYEITEAADAKSAVRALREGAAPQVIL